MARLPALIDTLALTDSRGRPTIEHIGQMMRATGLISRTKRGRGAGDVTVTDAVTMLIALNAAETPKKAPEAVTTFRSLVPEVAEVMIQPPSFAACLEGVTNFSEAIEALIVNAPTLFEWSVEHARAGFLAQGMSAEILEESGATPQFLATAGAHVAVEFNMPDNNGAVTIAPGYASPLNQPIVPFRARFVSPTAVPGEDHKYWDRTVTVSLGIETLLNLHQVLELGRRGG